MSYVDGTPQSLSALFGTEELIPLLREVSGPITTLTLEAELKEAARNRAITTGYLEGDFTVCPPFDDVEQKRRRQEAKRGQEILYILDQAADNGKQSPEDVLVRKYAEHKVWQAVVVEASRRSAVTHKSGRQEEADFCDDMLQRGLMELYEVPTAEVAQMASGEFTPFIDLVRGSTDQTAQSIAQDFLENYPFMVGGDVKTPRLNIEISEAIRRHLQTVFAPAFAALRAETGDITNEKIVEVTRVLLEKVGLAYINEQGERIGWDAVPTNKRNGFYTNSHEEFIECGKRNSDITWDAYEQLMVHEVGVHAWRTRNGRLLGSKILENELPGAADFEEGLGILFEVVWSGEQGVSRDHYRYLIAAYAIGVLDGNQHDKNETYHFISRLKEIELAAKKVRERQTVDRDAIAVAARRLMFEQAFRAFRGMPEGVVMIKDTSYYAQRVRIVERCNASQLKPERTVVDLLLAKVNSFDETQMSFVRGLIKEIAG